MRTGHIKIEIPSASEKSCFSDSSLALGMTGFNIELN
jgi:hypothetical protein